MNFDPINSTSLTELFVDDIETKIFSGELSPGDRLPSERDLAKSMNISQTIVNNGFSILVGRGLLTKIPRKGTFVADYIHFGGLNSLSSLIHYSRKDLPVNFLKPMFIFRLNNEKAFFKSASEYMTPADHAQINLYFNQLVHSTDIQEKSQIWYNEIHFLSQKSQNIIYSMITNGFEAMYSESLTRFFSVADTAISLDYIQKINVNLISKDYDQLDKAIVTYHAYEIKMLEENHFFSKQS